MSPAAAKIAFYLFFFSFLQLVLFINLKMEKKHIDFKDEDLRESAIRLHSHCSV